MLDKVRIVLFSRDLTLSLFSLTHQFSPPFLIKLVSSLQTDTLPKEGDINLFFLDADESFLKLLFVRGI